MVRPNMRIMRFRTLALAAVLACGLTAGVEAKPAKQKAVVHRSAQKGVVHRSAKKGMVRKSKIKTPKVRSAKAPKTVKHSRKNG